jgi:hypothetical protein
MEMMTMAKKIATTTTPDVAAPQDPKFTITIQLPDSLVVEMAKWNAKHPELPFSWAATTGECAVCKEAAGKLGKSIRLVRQLADGRVVCSSKCLFVVSILDQAKAKS